MKLIATVIISLGVLVAGLVFLAASICAFSSGMSAGDRGGGVVIALLALGAAAGGVLLLGKLYRED